MFDDQRQLTLLGPQSDYRSLKVALARKQINGKVALITAGWETDEHEDHDLKQAIGLPADNLQLFARTEQLFKDDPELIQTLRSRQDELRHLRYAYNDRLDYLLEAARQIIRKQEDLIDLDAERESAIDMVRQLDRQYFVRTSQIIDRYEENLQTETRPQVAAHRAEIAEILSQCQAILISGGHVAIILNRLKIFGALEMCPELPIFTWSGGAMALADQVVLFHDSPPQGAGNPEVLRAGMGFFQDILPLPSGRERLNLADSARVELFSRRFDQFACVLLDAETVLERENGIWNLVEGGQETRLGTCGKVVDFQA